MQVRTHLFREKMRLWTRVKWTVVQRNLFFFHVLAVATQLDDFVVISIVAGDRRKPRGTFHCFGRPNGSTVIEDFDSVNELEWFALSLELTLSVERLASINPHCVNYLYYFLVNLISKRKNVHGLPTYFAFSLYVFI